MDTQANPDLASHYGSGGQEVARQTGALPAAALAQWIDQFA